MRVHFGLPDDSKTISDAIPLYGTKEFESPTRSTIPMLSMLKHAPGAFSEIVAQLDTSPDNYDLYLEYKVRPPKGRGKASHTDVMLLSGDTALAIEAKWTEPMYETVYEWLGSEAPQPNRQQVLEGWLSLLQRHSATELNPLDFSKCTYQMVHRAASAAAAGSSARMAYLLFKPSANSQTATSETIFSQLNQLWALIGKPQSFPFFVVEVTIEPTAEFESIRHLPKSQKDTSDAVTAALLDDEPLFEFPSNTIKRVGEAT